MRERFAIVRGGGGIFLFAFDADDAFLRADGFHRELHTAHQLSGAFFHDDGVLVQQRFAFCAVGDDGFGLGVELDVRRKSAAARTDYARLSNFFCKIHFEILWVMDFMRAVFAIRLCAWRNNNFHSAFAQTVN